MFSSQRVLFLDSLFCYPVTFSFNHAAIFVWTFSHDFLHSHFHLCLSQHHYLTALHQPSWDVATRPLSSSHCTEDSGIVTSKPWPTAAQIVASTLTLSGTTHCCWLAVLFIDYRPYLRAIHCPVRAIVVSQHRSFPHHRPSIILRATQPSEPCLIDR